MVIIRMEIFQVGKIFGSDIETVRNSHSRLVSKVHTKSHWKKGDIINIVGSLSENDPNRNIRSIEKF